MASVQDIKVQFRKTQSPFNLTLRPVSHLEAVEKFHVGKFIDPPQRDVAMATPGKI